MGRESTLSMACGWCCVLVCSAAAVLAFAQDSEPAQTQPVLSKPVALPKPVTEGGRPLMEVLKSRQSTREFGPRKLPDQILSNLLWAACGISRPESGKRTAPTASNRQEIDVYVCMAEGVWLYDAKEYALAPVLAQDIRGLTGTQDFVKDAPVNLVFVADFAKMGKGPDEDKKWVAGADTGFVSQNVYLFCASEGLVTVVRGMVNRPDLAKAMNLRSDQWIVLAQTVGYPKAKP